MNMKTFLIAFLFLVLSPVNSAFADCYDWCIEECSLQATGVEACRAGCIKKCSGYEDQGVDKQCQAKADEAITSGLCRATNQ